MLKGLAWARHGIVGRGVLIDFVSYAAQNGIEYNPLDFYAVSLKAVNRISKECKFEFQAGDIVLLRTGIQRCSHVKHSPDLY